MQDSQALLRLEHIGVSFDGFQALDDVSIDFRNNELTCIIGPNGAGKSTLLDIITGLTKPDKGRVLFEGEDLLQLCESDIVNLGIARKFQTPAVFPDLDVQGNIAICLRGSRRVLRNLRKVTESERRDQIHPILQRVGLEHHAYLPARFLSHGQKQWLEIGMILAMNPAVILLDEPVTGMTPKEIEITAALIEDLLQHHCILLIDHDMGFIRSMAREVIVMHQGRILTRGTMQMIENDPLVKQVYLGYQHA